MFILCWAFGGGSCNDARSLLLLDLISIRVFVFQQDTKDASNLSARLLEVSAMLLFIYLY